MTKRTPKTVKPEPTAAETYAARRNDIARLLDVLQMELDKHDERAKDDPRNWGLPGNLGKVRGDLIDLVAFTSGMERERIEEFLRDAE
ncbi:MAG: hypothetical protein JNM80_00365 [Phycisphaerae bacterium]|nr:hypothetical protein [Phycisphaerae bacterium]